MRTSTKATGQIMENVTMADITCGAQDIWSSNLISNLPRFIETQRKSDSFALDDVDTMWRTVLNCVTYKPGQFLTANATSLPPIVYSFHEEKSNVFWNGIRKLIQCRLIQIDVTIAKEVEKYSECSFHAADLTQHSVLFKAGSNFALWEVYVEEVGKAPDIRLQGLDMGPKMKSNHISNYSEGGPRKFLKKNCKSLALCPAPSCLDSCQVMPICGNLLFRTRSMDMDCPGVHALNFTKQ